MKKADLLKKIARAAKEDEKKRHDRRYLEVMGFLVAKGFLRSNQDILPAPNKRVLIDDAIWAGKNVEPRILEMLPAAVLRLPKHFDLDRAKHTELAVTIDRLKRMDADGPALWGIAYNKLKVWTDFDLRDGRTKTFGEKKVTKTFRLSPAAISKLKERAKKLRCTETEALEKAINGDGV